MKKFSLLMVITLLCHCEIMGKSLWIPIDDGNNGKCVTITTIESNENTYKAKIEIHGYYDEPMTINGTTYHWLSFDEPSTLSFVGEPALPLISRLIALPKGEDFEVRIKDEMWSDEFFVGQIMPHQKSFLESEEEPPFEKNDTIYREEMYQTERLQVGNLQCWRGINNRALNICPIRYMPKEGKMSVLKEFIIEISFNNTASISPFRFNDMHMFLNQVNTLESDMAEQQRDSTDTYDYLIIAGNIPGVLECQALSDFRRWKAFKGHKTKVISTSTMTNVWTMGIKQCISSEYPKGVKYVLFIGDNDKIPLYSYYVGDLSKNAKSDYWYGCMDGRDDVEADINVGRFSTNNLSELTNMVNKTISYEKDARSFGDEVLLVAHREGAPYKYQGCSETIRTRIYNDSMTFTTAYGAIDSIGGDKATNAYVVNKINEKKNIVNYRGHGSYNCWPLWNYKLESFYDSQIDSLYNTTNDIYFCVACQIGNIFNQTCFMETYMRSNHGAAGMIAATEDTYTSSNNTYDKYLFSKLLNDSIYNIGNLNVASHIATIGNNNSYAIWNAFSYLCGCDPSLEIITDSTKSFDEYEIMLNGQNIVINTGNIEGYKVCMVNEGDSLLAVINSTGSSCSFPVPTENIYVVLNKHNFVPRIIYINVEDCNIQNKLFADNVDSYYIKDAAICAGYDVTDSIPYGNVIVESGSKLNISKGKGVLIKNGFECKLGGELRIK